MTRDTREPPGAEEIVAGESFLQRFHRRKTEARQAPPEDPQPAVAAVPDAPPVEPTDADMPPLASLTPESDYRGFLSPKVSETLRRAALRRLFHSPEFNVLDGLDDYAEDYTSFTALGDLVTADMRHQLEQAARRTAAALADNPVEGAPPPADSAQTVAAAPTHEVAPAEIAPRDPDTDEPASRSVDDPS